MNVVKNFFILISVLAAMLVAAAAGYNLAFRGLIFPRTSISTVDVSGLDKGSAEKLVELYFSREPNSVILRNGDKDNTRLDNFQIGYDFTWAVDQAMGTGRTGNWLTRLSDQVKSLVETRMITLPMNYDQDELEGIMVQIENETNEDPVWPSLKVENNKVVLIPGKNGLEVNTEQLKQEIIKQFGLPGKHVIDVPTQVIIAKEDPNLSVSVQKTAQQWLGKSLTLKGNNKSVVLNDTEVIDLFGLTGPKISEVNFQKLLDKIRPELETEPKNAVFVFEDGKVKQFSPEVVGGKIDEPAFRALLEETLYKPGASELNVSMIVTMPKVTADEVNNLGIKELIGVGKSKFAHSIAGRVFNVNLASSRINGVLIAPGDEFSFNNAVGEISKDTGYRSAYIISGGKTVLGDGGGVCQVSTTVFRAALSAGLPITERKAHAYRVGYYEQDSKPGIDATVYNPTADLKFKNDTGHYILVQTSVDTKNMTMEVDIYGTSDGRKSNISDPVISSQTAPPATLYVDDPTLPKGTSKQIDWSAWGAKVSFNYTVTRGDETIYEKTFYSNYQPWQAVYLVGTAEQI